MIDKKRPIPAPIPSFKLLGIEFMIQALIGVRDRAVLELFYSTGMRLSELVNINIGDFHLNNKLLRVIGKGKKERMIPYGRTAENAIKNYLKIRNISLNPAFAN